MESKFKSTVLVWRSSSGYYMHIMEDCPRTRLEGTLSDLHYLESDAIGWLGHVLLDFEYPLHVCLVEYIPTRIIIIILLKQDIYKRTMASPTQICNSPIFLYEKHNTLLNYLAIKLCED